MSVRSVGRIPGGYVTNHVYTWVDPLGRSVSPPPDLLEEHRSATLRRSNSQGRSHMQLLQDGDEKKVKKGLVWFINEQQVSHMWYMVDVKDFKFNFEAHCWFTIVKAIYKTRRKSHIQGETHLYTNTSLM